MNLPQPASKSDQKAWTAIQRVVAETLTRRVVERGEEVTTIVEAQSQSPSITDDIVARLSPIISQDRWVTRRRIWPWSRFPNPHQEAWIAIDAVVEEALVRYVVERCAPITTPEDASALAAHITNDVVKRLHPTVSRDTWTSSQ